MPADTYLNIERLLGAAAEGECDAVHPGYGFLAEHAGFARAVASAGLTWIGPAADVIALMGDKLAARQVAADAGVPPVPGAMVAVDDTDTVRGLGESLGWPLAVKAVHGGGGRGMRVIDGPAAVDDLLAAARRESQSSFGRPEVYIERFLARPRHVEVQLIADHHGGLVVAGDRDCSIQRRYQKLIEEAPAPRLSDALRSGLAEAASRLARAVGYTNAGTVEFLVEGDEFFFLEMNTRIQVEHPVTELVTGLDLVAEQIRVADGHPLSFAAADIVVRGAAIEVRINAEDTADGRFIPVPGTLRRFDPPHGPHVRVDTGYRAGDDLPPEYDNLIAKIAVWGEDRDDARLRAIAALRELRVDGVPTTAQAAAAVLAHDDFRTVAHSTRWLGDHGKELLRPVGPPPEVEVLGRWYRIPRFSDADAAERPAGSAGDVTPTGGPPSRARASAAGRRRRRWTSHRADAGNGDDGGRRGRRQRLGKFTSRGTGGDEDGECPARRRRRRRDGGARHGRCQRRARHPAGGGDAVSVQRRSPATQAACGRSLAGASLARIGTEVLQ